MVVLATASPALAKGPDQATISGPGLARPIVLDGNGEPGSGEHLGMLSDGSGLFLAMFGPSGGQALTSEAPGGALGPKYELAYRVPGGEPTPATVRQDLYPRAAGGPVTYTRAGQPSFGSATSGGWYRAPDGFAQLLVTLGVPDVVVPAAARPSLQPSAQPTSEGAAAGHAAPTPGTPWMAITAAALAACIAVVAAIALVRRRRTVAE
jgi:hypothetical protein